MQINALMPNRVFNESVGTHLSSKFIRSEQNADTLKIQHAKRVEPTKTKNAIETCAIKNSAYTITLKTE